MTAIRSPDRRGPAPGLLAAVLALAGVLAGCSVVNPPANPLPPSDAATPGATEFQ